MSEADKNVVPAHRCPHGFKATVAPANPPADCRDGVLRLAGEVYDTWAVACCPTDCKIGGWTSASFKL